NENCLLKIKRQALQQKVQNADICIKKRTRKTDKQTIKYFSQGTKNQSPIAYVDVVQKERRKGKDNYGMRMKRTLEQFKNRDDYEQGHAFCKHVRKKITYDIRKSKCWMIPPSRTKMAKNVDERTKNNRLRLVYLLIVRAHE
ncbi:hypothetical protein Tcan_01136, partial [Toxocara canis]